MAKIGTRLKELRIESGLYQSHIANLLSISLRQVQRYEKNQIDIPLSTVITLADYFHVSIDYLAGRSERKT